MKKEKEMELKKMKLFREFHDLLNFFETEILMYEDQLDEEVMEEIPASLKELKLPNKLYAAYLLQKDCIKTMDDAREMMKQSAGIKRNSFKSFLILQGFIPSNKTEEYQEYSDRLDWALELYFLSSRYLERRIKKEVKKA